MTSLHEVLKTLSEILGARPVSGPAFLYEYILILNTTCGMSIASRFCLLVGNLAYHCEVLVRLEITMTSLHEVLETLSEIPGARPVSGPTFLYEYKLILNTMCEMSIASHFGLFVSPTPLVDLSHYSS